MVSEHIARLAPGEAMTLGELRIERDGDAWIVRGPGEPRVQAEIAPDPDELRGVARFDASGRYRPLSGARTLPGGWFVRCGSAAQAVETVDTIYPLAVRHGDQWERGDLRVVPLGDVLERQSGRYDVAGRLSRTGRQAASDVLCRRCVRVPVWRGDEPGAGDIPCPEACSVLVALCREAALWEQDGPPEPADIDPSVEFAAFEEPGNEVREAYLADRYTTTEVS